MKRVFVEGGLVLAGLLLILIATIATFGLPVGESLRMLAEGSLSGGGLARTLVKATPLILAGLGMVLAWRAGIYNIGGEGQYLVGALGGAWVARVGVAVPALVLKPLVLIAAFLAGGLFAALAGLLMVKRHVQVVISTILLNFVALQFFNWAVTGPLQEASRRLPQTDRVPDSLMLFRLDRQNDLHTGVFVALASVAVVTVFLFLTPTGFRLRLVGDNPRAARANRIEPGRLQLLAIGLSGGLCGLAAGIEYLGITGQLGYGFSQQIGFLAIPVALLGGLHPIGALFSGLYFGALFAGSENLARFSGFGTTIVFVIQGVAVIGFVGLRALIERRRTPEAAL
ncbi:MAG: ABC transporter permease [Fimbriimonadaceae bacterium]|nr:ABC transporter permease [Fimbriimonadaceae bacterium]